MSDILSKFDAKELIALVAVAGGMLTGIIALVAKQWRRVRLAELEATLKQQMLERGMVPDEIERVLRASPEEAGAESALAALARRSSNGTAEGNAPGRSVLGKAVLVEKMVENGYEAKDIERVLRAFGDDDSAAGSGFAEKIALVEKMVENGYEGEDIARVLETFPSPAATNNLPVAGQGYGRGAAAGRT